MTANADAALAGPGGRGVLGLHALLAPLLVAAGLRLLWHLFVPVDLVSDAGVYHHGAAGIASGAGFAFANGDPNGFWPPGYSGFLAGFYWLMGPNSWTAFWPNLMLGLVAVWLHAAIAGCWFGARAARLAAWATAVYPTFLVLPNTILSENLFLVLQSAFVLLVATPRRHGLLSIGAAAVVLAASILVRPTALLLPLLVVVGAHGPRWLWAGCARAAVISVLAVLLCVPWGLRQQAVFGEFTLSAFNGGPVLWFGNHDNAPSMVVPERFATLELVPRHHAMQREAVDYIKANPGVFAQRMVTRSATALRSETFAIVWSEGGITQTFGAWAIGPLRWLCSGGWYLLLAASAWAAVRTVRGRRLGRADAIVAAGVLCASVPFVLFDSQNRYHAPMIPLLIAYAARLAHSAPTPAD